MDRAMAGERPRGAGRDPRSRDDAAEYTRAPNPRRYSEPGRPVSRGAERASADDRRPSARPNAPRGDSGAPRRRPAPAREQGPRLHGIVAVLGVFLVTLAGAGIDSFVGIGLGLITLVALVASTCVATLAVRRRDMLTVVVSPPLVFVAVAMVNIGLAPSAPFNLPTLATLLIRGFPTMAVATVAAIVLGLVRLASRR
jgi:hypothetical protein